MSNVDRTRGSICSFSICKFLKCVLLSDPLCSQETMSRRRRGELSSCSGGVARPGLCSNPRLHPSCSKMTRVFCCDKQCVHRQCIQRSQVLPSGMRHFGDKENALPGKLGEVVPALGGHMQLRSSLASGLRARDVYYIPYISLLLLALWSCLQASV